ncbi:MAG TPA: hypothetical protein VMV92_26325 [Streptosporangiaceae bacterium]|nr:hypothetical protein [Streptosporangiaceae bacterium]
MVTEPLAEWASPKLSPLAPAGIGGVGHAARVQPWAGGKNGLDVQYTRRPDEVR